MIRQKLFCALVCALAVSAAVVGYSAPVFYLSTQTEATTPGLLNLTGVAPNSSGTLHIWSDSDIRLSSVSLDVIEVGGAIKFTSATILNPLNRRWVITDNPVVTDSLIINIAGGMLHFNPGGGIGAGSPDGATVLVASLDYTAIRPGHSSLFLRVGELVIADWDGNNPNVHFGTPTSPVVFGGVPGGMGIVGSIEVIPEPATLCLIVPAVIGAVVVRRRGA
ncbi:MAG TPA: hypothetical protein VGK58_02400 [Lacipirellulaceae bacterium]